MKTLNHWLKHIASEDLVQYLRRAAELATKQGEEELATELWRWVRRFTVETQGSQELNNSELWLG
ncbi:MAG: hypothetical protein J7M05_09720 [Anaerolineae bacterium]|nr:hypothetical protein [Anaerolineae bacterium]